MATKHKGKSKTQATKRSTSSAPWDGSVDTDELKRPGGALLAMLSGRARQLGHTRGELAKHLNVTYGYIAQLASGHRRSEHISDDFANACAAYLGLPKVTVLMAAGALKAEDLFERPDEIASALPDAIEYVLKHPTWGPLAPPEVQAKDASAPLQFFVVRLFEAATGHKLIPGEHSIENIARSLKELDDLRQKLLKQPPG
jgi:transcriptional regulator with XRE-family HTH domain